MEVESRMKSFLSDLSRFNYDHIAIVAHQAPQLALDVILKNQTWEGAIASDWRKSQSWQPGWEYFLDQSVGFNSILGNKKSELN